MRTPKTIELNELHPSGWRFIEPLSVALLDLADLQTLL